MLTVRAKQDDEQGRWKAGDVFGDCDEIPTPGSPHTTAPMRFFIVRTTTEGLMVSTKSFEIINEV